MIRQIRNYFGSRNCDSCLKEISVLKRQLQDQEEDLEILMQRIHALEEEVNLIDSDYGGFEDENG